MILLSSTVNHRSDRGRTTLQPVVTRSSLLVAVVAFSPRERYPAKDSYPCRKWCADRKTYTHIHTKNAVKRSLRADSLWQV
jgi:hypothetical protein